GSGRRTRRRRAPAHQKPVPRSLPLRGARGRVGLDRAHPQLRVPDAPTQLDDHRVGRSDLHPRRCRHGRPRLFDGEAGVMRPLSESTVLVTGATDGLGKGVATALAAAGARVLLHGRDDARGERTLAEIRAATGSDRLGWYRADFASLAQVRGLAERVRAEQARLDVLLNNAGIGTTLPGE